MESEEVRNLRTAMSLRYLDNIQSSKKAYAAVLEPICRDYGLTRSEVDVILFLANNPEYDRAADIVTIRGMAKSHVSLSVGNLEKRGLLVRQSESSDRRTAHLKLTEAALPVAEAAQARQKQFFRQLFAGISQEELVLWGNILKKICSNIESMQD